MDCNAVSVSFWICSWAYDVVISNTIHNFLPSRTKHGNQRGLSINFSRSSTSCSFGDKAFGFVWMTHPVAVILKTVNNGLKFNLFLQAKEPWPGACDLKPVTDSTGQTAGFLISGTSTTKRRINSTTYFSMKEEVWLPLPWDFCF